MRKKPKVSERRKLYAELLHVFVVGLLLFLPFIIIMASTYFFSFPFSPALSQTAGGPFSAVFFIIGAVYVPWLMFCFGFLFDEKLMKKLKTKLRRKKFENRN